MSGISSPLPETGPSAPHPTWSFPIFQMWLSGYLGAPPSPPLAGCPNPWRRVLPGGRCGSSERLSYPYQLHPDSARVYVKAGAIE